MELLLNIGYISVAIAVIIVSSNILITNASAVASILKVPSIIVGTLLIGFGNALPELAISVISALNGSTGIAIGNGYGSNLVNTGLVLGTIAVITPLAVHRLLLIREIPWLFGSLLLATLAISNGKLERLESAVLLALCVTYTITSIRAGLKEPGSEEQSSGGKKELFIRICMVLAGLAALSLGSKLFIFSAVNLARMMKISEEVIGISIVALGTSLPELFSSVIAVVRKENDLAIGNLVGANIFNLLGVIGVAGVITPAAVDSSVLCTDAPVTLVMTLFLFVCTCSKKITRINGIMLLLMYTVFISFMIGGMINHQ